MWLVHEQPIAGEHLLPAVTPTDHCDNTACEVSIGGQLSPEQKHAIQELIDEYRDVFSAKLGETHLIEHSIRVTDETPCYQAPYKIPEALREQIYDELMQMIRNNVIQFDDQTKYCSPLVIVKKPGGSLRLVINFT